MRQMTKTKATVPTIIIAKSIIHVVVSRRSNTPNRSTIFLRSCFPFCPIKFIPVENQADRQRHFGNNVRLARSYAVKGQKASSRKGGPLLLIP
jgi:hypothetical protein